MDFFEIGMKVAIVAAKQSNDPHHKVGAALYLGENFIKSAYNYIPYEMIIPRKNPDDLDPNVLQNLVRRNNGLKNALVIHAEENLLMENSPDYSDGIVFITKAPCLDCALRITEHDISMVVCPIPYQKSKWHKTQMEGMEVFNKAGIIVKYIDVRYKTDGLPYLNRK